MGEEETELFIDMVSAGDLDGLRVGIRCGMDANARDQRGVPAIILATEHGHDRIVLTLIDGGADVNACDGDGRTAIMVARNAG